MYPRALSSVICSFAYLIASSTLIPPPIGRNPSGQTSEAETTEAARNRGQWRETGVAGARHVFRAAVRWRFSLADTSPPALRLSSDVVPPRLHDGVLQATEGTNMTRTSGLPAVVWIGTLVFAPAIVMALVGLVTGWTAAFLGWALTNLFEMFIPGYAEWKAE